MHLFLPDNIPHIVTWGYLLLPSLHIIECSDEILFVFPPEHLLYHPPAPVSDNSIIIVAVVSMWVVLFM